MPGALLAIQELADRYGVPQSTIWRWSLNDTLPAPVELAEGHTAWDAAAVERAESQRPELRRQQ